MDENTKAIVASNLTLAYHLSASEDGLAARGMVGPGRTWDDRVDDVIEIYIKFLKRLTPEGPSSGETGEKEKK